MTESKINVNLEEKVKTFKDLKNEIVDTGKCCSCGACIAYCESQNFNVIEMDEDLPRFKSDKNAENCTECGLCYFLCPQTETLIEQLNNAHQVENELGHIIDIIAAKTTDEKIGKVGQDGGVISTALAYLFEKHKIDGAVVSEFDKEMKPYAKIIYDKEDLIKSAGTRYTLSPNILPLKDLYNISSEVMEKKGIYEIEQLRLAFVGTPCQCRAISKMKFLSVKPAHVIKYVIGLFCFENFYYDDLMEAIKAETKLDPSNIKKTIIKKNFFVLSKDEKKFEIDLKKLDNCVREHCHICDEFTARFTDISVGASGAPEGYSIIITRTEKGQVLINSLLANNFLKQYIIPAEKSKNWKKNKLTLYKKMLSYKAEHFSSNQ